MFGGKDKQTLSCEKTGVEATVADCETSCLVYYLNCVHLLLLDPDDQRTIPEKYRTGYEQVLAFTSAEKEELLRIARQWHPDVMVGSKLFQPDENNTICGSHDNEFVTVTATETKMNASDMKIQKVSITLKAMCFRQTWLLTNFHTPYDSLEKELNSEKVRRLGLSSDGKKGFLDDTDLDFPRLFSAASSQPAST
jgi:hypothetical protein